MNETITPEWLQHFEETNDQDHPDTEYIEVDDFDHYGLNPHEL